MRKHFTLLLLIATGFWGAGLQAQSAGALDISFDADGIWMQDIAVPGLDAVYGIAEQADGKIVLAGYTTDNGNANSIVMRLNSDGSPDLTFDTDGKIIFDVGLGTTDRLYDLALQADGKIVVVGYVSNGSDNDALFIRLNPDGSPDASFGSNGIVKEDYSFGEDEILYGVSIYPDGRILGVGRQEFAGDANLFAARLLANGQKDTGFDATGNVMYDIDMDTDVFYAADITPDGKIVAVGSTQDGTSQNVVFARLDDAGQLDLSFSGDGFFSADLGFSDDDYLYDCKVLADGSVVACGALEDGGNTDAMVIRLKSNGILDNSFSSDGKAIFDFSLGNFDIFRGLEVQSDGKIIATGFSNQMSSRDFLAARILSNGDLDLNFNGSGFGVYDVDGGSSDNMRCMALQADGKILIGGYASSQFAIVRIENSVPTSMESAITNQNLVAYPNPFWENLFVEVDMTAGETGSVNVWTLQGKLVATMEMGATAGAQSVSLTLPLADLPAGSYLLQVQTGMASHSQIIIKQ